MTEAPPFQSSGGFGRLYVEAAGDPSLVPWASEAASPVVSGHLARQQTGIGRAIVVGCSLGDDSEAVAAAGYDTLAFDVSPAAIAWCHRGFPDSAVSERELQRLVDEELDIEDLDSVSGGLRSGFVGIYRRQIVNG